MLTHPIVEAKMGLAAIFTMFGGLIMSAVNTPHWSAILAAICGSIASLAIAAYHICRICRGSKK